MVLTCDWPTNVGGNLQAADCFKMSNYSYQKLKIEKVWFEGQIVIRKMQRCQRNNPPMQIYHLQNLNKGFKSFSSFAPFQKLLNQQTFM